MSLYMHQNYIYVCVFLNVYIVTIFYCNNILIVILYIIHNIYGASQQGASGKEPTCQCRRCKKCRFHP